MKNYIKNGKKMAQFRLTQKFAKDCGISNLSNPEDTSHPLDDWFIAEMPVNFGSFAFTFPLEILGQLLECSFKNKYN